MTRHNLLIVAHQFFMYFSPHVNQLFTSGFEGGARLADSTNFLFPFVLEGVVAEQNESQGILWIAICFVRFSFVLEAKDRGGRVYWEREMSPFFSSSNQLPGPEHIY